MDKFIDIPTFYEYMERILNQIRCMGYTSVIMYDWRDIHINIGVGKEIIVSSPSRKRNEFFITVKGADTNIYRYGLGLKNYGPRHPYSIDTLLYALEKLINNYE